MILPSAPRLLSKSRCVCLFFLQDWWRESKRLGKTYVSCYWKQQWNRTLLILKPKSSSRTGRYRNIKNNTPNHCENDCNSPPSSYGIHFGNHISPGKHNCGRFSVSTVSWTHLTAERHSDLWRSTVGRIPQWVNTLRTEYTGIRENPGRWANRPAEDLRLHTGLEITLFQRLPHRAFISNPKHPDLYGQLGNRPPQHTGATSAAQSTERSRNNRNASCVLRPYSESAKPWCLFQMLLPEIPPPLTTESLYSCALVFIERVCSSRICT